MRGIYAFEAQGWILCRVLGIIVSLVLSCCPRSFADTHSSTVYDKSLTLISRMHAGSRGFGELYYIVPGHIPL